MDASMFEGCPIDSTYDIKSVSKVKLLYVI